MNEVQIAVMVVTAAVAFFLGYIQGELHGATKALYKALEITQAVFDGLREDED